MTAAIDARISKARGFTADFMSVHVVTRCPRTGQPARVASFKGSDYDRAVVRMATYHQETGRSAWLVRGTRVAFLPFPAATR